MNRYLRRLEERLIDILQENPSSHAPYHNTDHMLGVWKIAIRLWFHERIDVGLKEITWEWAVLMVSSLFHDYGHSAGVTSDEDNVNRTREAVADILSKYGFTFPSFVKEAIDSAIACTEFPFVRAPKNKLEMVLRDADLLYATLTMEPTIIMEDLRKEMEVKFGRSITLGEMYDGQVTFLSSAKMFTRTGQMLWDSNTATYLNLMANYAGIDHDR